MSSSQNPKLYPNPNSSFNEKQWVIHVRRTLDEDLEEDTETPVHIFTVPKNLMAIHPDSYIPQQVAIGPYHGTRPELHEMERYKLAAAKRHQKEFQNVKVQHLVDELMKIEPAIRACYHNVLRFSGETLAWMMAVDASFLLEFLRVCAVKTATLDHQNVVIGSRLSRLVGLAGNKAAHNAILKDISMLENQIPLFVLRKLLEIQFSSLEEADEILFRMLIGVCEELSPFKTVVGLGNIRVTECAHLLDVLYHFCVPKFMGFLRGLSSVEEEVVLAIKEEDQEPALVSDGQKELCVKISKFQQPWNIIKRIMTCKPLKMMVKLPWTFLSNLPILKLIKRPVEDFFNSLDEEGNYGDGNSTKAGSSIQKPPLLEEITVPCVVELAKAGVRFEPTSGDISTITFDSNNNVLYLPIISLDVTSEVVLRNLVAYEACSAPGPLVLARYVELMNGIIDTEEDARFLRERGIIVNRLKSDEEVAKLWNGMNRCIRLTKVPFLDKVIEDVNRYYNGRWKVRFEKSMKRYVFEYWRLLTFIGAILMLLLMSLEAFCSVYNCSRVLPIKNFS